MAWSPRVHSFLHIQFTVAGGVGATPPPVPKRTFSSGKSLREVSGAAEFTFALFLSLLDDSDETPSDTSPAAPPRVPSRTFSPGSWSTLTRGCNLPLAFANMIVGVGTVSHSRIVQKREEPRRENQPRAPARHGQVPDL